MPQLILWWWSSTGGQLPWRTTSNLGLHFWVVCRWPECLICPESSTLQIWLLSSLPILAPRRDQSRVFKRFSTKIEYSNGDKIASWQTTSRIEMIWSGCHIEVQNKRRRCTSYLGYARCGLGCLYGAVSQTVLGARLCRRLSWYQALLRMSSCKLEACRDMAGSEYGIKDIGDNIACQRARVSAWCPQV